jgi:streptogramin lyase
MPSSIITGPDGNLWFADSGYSEIVRVTVTPVTRTVFPFAVPTELAAGPDGNIWITSNGRQSITRMTPGGASTEFGLPMDRARPLGIVAGPDGNLWFTDPGTGGIGRITPEGVVTEFTSGSHGASRAILPGSHDPSAPDSSTSPLLNQIPPAALGMN